MMLSPQETGIRISARRKELGLSLAEVAQRLKVAPSTIQRYEKGQFAALKRPMIEAIAAALEMPAAQLLDEPDLSPAIQPYRPVRVMPILGRVAAGLPLLAEENVEGYAACDFQDGENYFALRVCGDSMTAAGIGDGDLVVVRQQDRVDDGEIAVVLVNGDDATVKRFYCNGSIVTLAPQSYNPIHQIQVYSLKDTPIRVIGRVMEVRKRF